MLRHKYSPVLAMTCATKNPKRPTFPGCVVCACVCVCVCVIYIYIVYVKERERERKKEKEIVCVCVRVCVCVIKIIIMMMNLTIKTMVHSYQTLTFAICSHLVLVLCYHTVA